MYKNEQKVQFTVIHVQRNHVHLKKQLTCKTNFTNNVMYIVFVAYNKSKG